MLHTMYKYVLNSVVKISLLFAQYFEYYAIILGAVFSWIRCIWHMQLVSYTLSHKQDDFMHITFIKCRIFTGLTIVQHSLCNW